MAAKFVCTAVSSAELANSWRFVYTGKGLDIFGVTKLSFLNINITASDVDNRSRYNKSQIKYEINCDLVMRSGNTNKI